jgi:hypothetical protein
VSATRRARDCGPFQRDLPATVTAAQQRRTTSRAAMVNAIQGYAQVYSTLQIS